MKRKDGTRFLSRIIAKSLDSQNPQHGTVWIAEDITEKRRHADEVVRLVREQEAILGTASIGIVFVQDRRIVRCNKRYEEMYGYGAGELEGKSTSILYGDAIELERVQDIYAQLARGQTVRRSELRRRKDGTTFWMRIDGRAVDPQDPHKGSVWTCEDVTETRKAAEQLERVLAEQQALLNNVVVGIAFSRDRKIARCNRRFEELFGFAPAAAIGASWRELYFTDDEYEPPRRHLRRPRPRPHALARGLGAQAGRVGVLGAHLGARGRARRSGARLRVPLRGHQRAEARRRSAASPAARAGRGARERARRHHLRARAADRALHRRFEELFGFSPGELIGQSTRFMFRTDEEYEAGGAPVYAAVWRGETQQLRRQHVRKDGRLIWCSLSGRAVQEGDPAQGSVWLFEDITQQHEAEERIERALAEQELILDNAAVGIAFVRNRIIQRCNRFLEEMVGAGPGELVGNPSSVLFADSDDSERAGSLAYMTTSPGNTHDAEWRFQRRDGSIFRCRTRGRRIDLGEELQEWIWSFEDVTAEREADFRVQRALAEQELILDNATVGIAFLRTARYQRCNPTLEQMFGYGPGELIGREHRGNLLLARGARRPTRRGTSR